MLSNPFAGNAMAIILGVIYDKSKLNPSPQNLFFYPDTFNLIKFNIFFFSLNSIMNFIFFKTIFTNWNDFFDIEYKKFIIIDKKL